MQPRDSIGLIHTTIHSFVVYYSVNENVEYKSFVVISKHSHHDTATLYCFQKHLIKYIEDTATLKECAAYQVELLHTKEPQTLFKLSNS